MSLNLYRVLRMRAILFHLLLCLATLGLTAGPGGKAVRRFIENKGQIGDQHGRPNDRVRYLVVRPGLNVQLRHDGFSYDSYVVDHCGPNEPSGYYFHRIDVDLVGADPRPRITATDPSADHLQYYTHITAQTNGDKGAVRVRGYARVTYHDVWPNIDMEWFLDAQERPEYQFVVRPGGDVAQIRLRYRGADAMRLVDGALQHVVQHGVVREYIPASYLLASGTRVEVSYVRHHDGTIGVALPPIDLALDHEALVIDPLPELVLGTYYGGDMIETIDDVVATATGGVVMVGKTGSATNIATQGAHQSAVSAFTDAMVVHLNASMQRTWGTYYGGWGSDGATACALLRDGSIVVTGPTSSSEGIATIGAHQTSYSGEPLTGTQVDGFVAVLTSNGVRLWGTYVGGEEHDHPNDVAILPEDNIVIVGETASKTGIPTPGTHQGYLDTGVDAFMMMFDGSGARKWGTYYGRSSTDRATAVASTAEGTFIVVGETRSDGFATPGCHQPVIGENNDGFIAEFRSDGTRAWGTYYGGDGYDEATDVVLTPSGEIVVVGTTAASESGIATEGTHRRTPLRKGGDGAMLPDGFIAMFDRSGTRKWGTLYGGDDIDQVHAVATTNGGEIVIAGLTQSQQWVASNDAHQTQHGGGTHDACVAGFSATGRMLWGTYYGGDRDDQAMATAITASGRVVVVGTTESTTSIATPGALQETLHLWPSSSRGRDGFLAVFSDHRTVSVVTDETGQRDPDQPWIALHPNPAMDAVRVSTSTSASAVLEVVDIMGRVVTTMHVQPGQTQTSIDVSSMPAGLYLVRLVMEASTVTSMTYLVIGAR